jgi:ABC-2 type transport system ATP-binding protein
MLTPVIDGRQMARRRRVPEPRAWRRPGSGQWRRVSPPAYRRAVGSGSLTGAEDEEEDEVEAVIDAQGLVKRYGEVVALDGLDLQVPQGTVLGLLGPNGAGKTTAVRILTTLLIPDAGEATIGGVDLRTNPEGVRRIIGLSGQYAAVDEYLTGYENLDMIGRLYRLGRRRARARARELLDVFDLADAGDRPVKGYSGGMRRRLDLAGALVAEPAVLFLDEPTTGLDPRSRTDMWEVIRQLVGHGTTLLLTTQYLEEADRLADEIVVIDHGRAIARGTADQLKAQVGGERLELVVERSDQLDDARRVLTEVAVGEIQIDEHTRRLTAPCAGGAKVLTTALRRLDAEGVEILDVGLRRPTLDDVFLTLTGHVAEESSARDGDGPDEQSGTPGGDGRAPATAGLPGVPPSSDGHGDGEVRR